MKFLGVVGIEKAIRAIQDNKETLAGIYETDLVTTTEDTVINDILPAAASAKYPIPVLDEDGSLSGIVSKASVLASLV
jgi:glycine betaine/proline transport system ATP-binding protein